MSELRRGELLVLRGSGAGSLLAGGGAPDGHWLCGPLPEKVVLTFRGGATARAGLGRGGGDTGSWPDTAHPQPVDSGGRAGAGAQRPPGRVLAAPPSPGPARLWPRPSPGSALPRNSALLVLWRTPSWAPQDRCGRDPHGFLCPSS